MSLSFTHILHIDFEKKNWRRKMSSIHVSASGFLNQHTGGHSWSHWSFCATESDITKFHNNKNHISFTTILVNSCYTYSKNLNQSANLLSTHGLWCTYKTFLMKGLQKLAWNIHIYDINGLKIRLFNLFHQICVFMVVVNILWTLKTRQSLKMFNFA